MTRKKLNVLQAFFSNQLNCDCLKHLWSMLGTIWNLMMVRKHDLHQRAVELSHFSPQKLLSEAEIILDNDNDVLRVKKDFHSLLYMYSRLWRQLNIRYKRTGSKVFFIEQFGMEAVLTTKTLCSLQIPRPILLKAQKRLKSLQSLQKIRLKLYVVNMFFDKWILT